MKLTIKVNKQDVQSTLEDLTKVEAKKVSVKGFRKGKAPLNLAREKLDQSKLQQRALEHHLSQAYLKVLREKKLSPVSYPKIDLKTVEKNGDFVFEAEIIEKPAIQLGDYQSALKAAFAKDKIWTPDKGSIESSVASAKPSDTVSQSAHPKSGNQPNQPPTDDSDKKLALLFDTLLKTVKLEVPQLLLDREVARSLSRLLDQVNRLGLKIEDYLTSIGKTQETIKQDYQKTAADNLKLEFILQEIASDQKITVSDAELDQLINTIKDPKTKHHANHPEERINLKLVLLKRKTVSRLLQFTQ